MKKEKNDELIPDIHTRKSLEALADFFAAARQLRFAAGEVGGDGIEVASTTTVRRGLTYVKNWVGNLFQAISSASLEKVAASLRPVTPESADAVVAEISKTASQKATKKRPKTRESEGDPHVRKLGRQLGDAPFDGSLPRKHQAFLPVLRLRI